MMLVRLLRGIGRAKTYSVCVVATLAIALAGVASGFMVLESTRIQGLPYSEPATLVVPMFSVSTAPLPDPLLVPAGLLLALPREGSAVRAAAGYSLAEEAVLAAGEELPVSGAVVTHEFFDLFDERPLLGRMLGSEDTDSANIVISYELWNILGADPNIVGTSVHFSREVLTVVGVAPSRFRVPTSATDYWVPMSSGLVSSASTYAYGFARLRPGVSLERASAEASGLVRGLQQTPGLLGTEEIRLVSLGAHWFGDIRIVVGLVELALFGALLLAASNLAWLSRSHFAERGQEFAVRTALGAKPTQLAGLVVAQLGFLHLVGGGLALLLTRWNSVTYIAPLVSGAGNLAPPLMTLRVVMFLALCLALAFGICSYYPLRWAWRFATFGPAGHVGSSSFDTPHSAARSRWILSLEVAIAVCLLTVSLLFGAAASEAVESNRGFAVEDLAFARTAVARGTSPNERLRSLEDMLDELRGRSGAGDAAFMNRPPWEGPSYSEAIDADDDPATPEVTVGVRVVTPGVEVAAGLELLNGRRLEEAEAEPGLLVTTSLVRAGRGRISPGSRIRLLGEIDFLVVGEIADLRGITGSSPGAPEALILSSDIPSALAPVLLNVPTLLMRGAAGGDGSAQSQIRSLLAKSPVLGAREIGVAVAKLEGEIRPIRVGTYVSSVLALVGLTLALTGVSGTTKQQLHQRMSEIAVRRALGAPRSSIAILIGGQMLGALVSGTLVGCAAAFGARQVLGGVDPLLVPGATAVWFLVGIATVWVAFVGGASLPLRRALSSESIHGL